MRNRMSKEKTKGLAESVLIWLVNIYVFIMMAIYPLVVGNKYYDISDVKWAFYKWTFIAFIVVFACVFVGYIASSLKQKKTKEFFANAYKNMFATDWFVLAYLILCTISTLASPYRDKVIWGYDGWYMGFVAQVSFVLVYFVVSRFWRWDSINLFFYLIAAFLVFFLAVIMRFRIDPFSMYDAKMDDYYLSHFLSTLGQNTWYSSYMVLIIPLGMIAYWCAQKLWQKFAFGAFLVMSFMTAVTQNSDSAYPAMAGMFFIFFWISFDSNEKFLRFLECLIIALASFKLIGLLQMLFPEQAVPLDALSIFMSQSVVTLVLFIVVLAFYFLLRFVIFQKTDLQIESFAKMRWGVLALAAVVIFAIIIYIVLNSTGKLPEQYALSAGYLVFNDAWGNNRGVSWRCSVEAFFKAGFVQKLFGVGPDGFLYSVYMTYQQDFVKIFGERIVQGCAHNEWLNTLINEGLFGLVAYLGIFVSAFRDCMKNGKKYLYLYGVAMAVAAYFLHNFFCYQQVICTPIIFILMGMAGSVIRYGYKEGYKA